MEYYTDTAGYYSKAALIAVKVQIDKLNEDIRKLNLAVSVAKEGHSGMGQSIEALARAKTKKDQEKAYKEIVEFVDVLEERSKVKT